MASRATRRETGYALLLALCVSALVVGGRFVDRARATASASIDAHRATSVSSARDPLALENTTTPLSDTSSLADADVVGDRAYRYTIERLSRGELPLWNTGIHAGVPWLANPEHGVLDPQVWISALCERIGGRELSSASFVWLAWLRFAAAGLGAYLLARALGLERAGASLAGIGFGLSGFLVCRLDFAASHVAPFLPWIFLAIERACSSERARRPRSVVALALLAAASILGGDPQAAAFGLVASVMWIAVRHTQNARGATFSLLALFIGIGLSTAAWLPFAEYLGLSGAMLGHRPLVDPQPFDFVALGLVLITIAIVLRWRALDTDDEKEDSARQHAPRWAGVMGVVLCLMACVAILARRGWPEMARIALVGDVLGTPMGDGFRGKGSFIDGGSAHIALTVFALAIASFLSARGVISRRGSIQVMALVSLLLSLGMPGVVDAWRAVPFVGLVDPACAAGVSAMFCSLLAGEALESCSIAARQTSALVVMGLVALCVVHRAGPVLTPAIGAVDPPEGLVNWTERPSSALDGGHIGFAGWIHPGVPFERLAVRIEALDARGRVVPGQSREIAVVEETVARAVIADAESRSLAGESTRMPTSARANAPTDAPASGPTSDVKSASRVEARHPRYFRAPDIAAGRLDDGVWRFSLDFYGRDALGHEVRTASRTVAVSALAREPRLSVETVVSTLTTIAVLLFVPVATGGAAWLAVALVLLQSILFACAVLPSIAIAGETRRPETERLLPRALCVARIVERDRVSSVPLSFDPAHEAVLEPGAKWRPEHPFTQATIAPIQDYSDEIGRLHVQLDGDGLLVLMEQAFPGWHVHVDGVEQELLTADSTYRAVALSSGEHDVEFRFAPASLRIGAWVSSAAAVALLLTAWVVRRGDRSASARARH